jgi:sporulation protein YlmC with PRC-barrel domain
MSEPIELTIGAVVRCQDGECGELRRIVVESDKEVVTHLVVAPKHGAGKPRLVPVGLVEAATPHEIRLRCTLERFETLQRAEETDVTPGFGPVPAASSLSLPLFGIRGLALAASMGGTGLLGPLRVKPHAVTEEDLQAGEGEVSSGQPVHASDGPVGHVYGLVVGPGGQVSHVLLGEGHLWGKKEVAIPISAVKTVVDDGVYLTLTKREVGDLPPVDLERLA